MMSEDTKSKSPLGEPKAEPDYFGYYIREIQELLSQKEDFLSSPFSKDSSPFSSSKCGKAKVDDLDIHHCNGIQGASPSGSSSLFSNGIGDGISDFKRERLKTSLKQSVTFLSREVDEMLQPVLAMYQIKTHISNKELLASNQNAADGDVDKPPYKKQKISSPPATGISVRVGTINSHDEASGEDMDSELADAVLSEESQFKDLKSSRSDCKTRATHQWKDVSNGSEERMLPLDVNNRIEKEMNQELEDLLSLHDTGGAHAREVVKTYIKKYSDEISAQLAKMEQQLEDLLDLVMSRCRQMTLAEKKQLQRLVQKLPPKNLHRVVEIVQHKKPEEVHLCSKIDIDLLEEDNATLWRLFYYVEAVASAMTLACR